MTKPRVGFLGVGWIGRNRMEALAQSGLIEIVGVSDPAAENAAAAAKLAPGCASCELLDHLLDAGLDGLVIATPSALHADQAIAALERRVAVFCQKPLGRTAAETSDVVAAARSADRLLGVDLSYRFVHGIALIRELIHNGDLGTVYSADLVFHNAYGPDKAWFYDAALSGGGCVIDLGSHLVDLALWMLEDGPVVGVASQLFAKGQRLSLPTSFVEDYATAQLDFAGGASVRVACSWNLPAGSDAVIEASFYGTKGGATLRNVDGSFYDFRAERLLGTSRQALSTPPDHWSGRAAVDWATRLAAGEGFDVQSEKLVTLAAVLDQIYGRVESVGRAPGDTREEAVAEVLAESAVGL
jgi:predicted dehydrogenase